MYSVIIAIRKDEFQPELENLDGFSLLSKKLDLLKKIAKIDEIIIASNIKYLEDFSKKEGFKFFLRDDESLKDNAQIFIKNLLKIVKNKELIFTPCTCLFLKENLLDECIKEYENLNFSLYDSLLTCTILQALVLDDNGALNFKLIPNELNTRKLPRLYSIKNACFIISSKIASKYLNYWGKLPYKKVLDKNDVFEVKDENDFLFLKNVLRRAL